MILLCRPSFLPRDTHVMFAAQVDPGESLSDCEKDTDEVMDEEDSKITDEEEEDSFVVPDGYLSDSEVYSSNIE